MKTGSPPASARSTIRTRKRSRAAISFPWIQRNRRIFFLGSWLGSFIGGQRSAESLALVDEFLRTHATWPRDLREKVLQSEDDLERTVRIRERCRTP